MDNFCGKRLDGRYEIREIIGVGGMAVVYKAYDNIDDRIVAIKILKDEYLTNEEFKRRFKNESKAIAVLSHPNIVRVYNVSFGDRLQYIVMEYVDGITLKEFIEQQGVINWKEAVYFTGQILAALQHAHDKGIVHQDIKPQNIMLLQDGTIKVTDFGIARFSRMDTNTTSENAIGSVHYISPEQARGEMTDAKADIYSVGVALYEMLTGQLPFQSDNAVSVAIMQLQQEPKRLREIVPTIPLGLEQITMRAMQKNPNDRYRSAAEMLMDINEFKRNPAVKFNYTYFVDHEPTKYVNSANELSRTVSNNRAEDTKTEEVEKKRVNKTTAIMMGAISGVVVLAIVIISVLIALDNKKIEVPNFKNMNYYDEIERNPDYSDFVFELEYKEDKNYDDGTVLKQNPEDSVRVKKGTVITLTVVKNDSVVISRDIIGKTEKEAKDMLISSGLMYEIEYKYSKDNEPGVVLDTKPAPGETVKKATKVTLVLSTNTNDMVPVPLLVGGSLENAKKLLEAAGLQLGEVTEADSSEEAGTVLEQTISENIYVPKNSKIDVTVSTGIPGESSVDITVTLPVRQKNGILKIYVNHELQYTSGELLLDGAAKTFEVKGKGEVNEYLVTVDDVQIQKGNIDFTKVPAVISNVEDIPFEETANLTSVTDKTKDEAVKALKSAGFNNIKFVEKSSETVPAGKVISQSPSAGSSYPVSTEIVLEISTGPASPEA